MNQLDFSIPQDLAQSVASEVDADEKIVWAVQPDPSRLAWQALPLVLFGIPWTAFSIFWMFGASAGVFATNGLTGGFQIFGLCFVLFGLPFVLVGFWLLSSPYWFKRAGRRSVYVITDRRAIIFKSNGWNKLTIRSFDPDKLGDLRRKQNSDGSGDLVFAQDWSNSSGGGRNATDVGFLAVANVKEAETRIRELIARSTDNA